MIGHIGEFSPGKEEFSSYVERLEQFFVVNDVQEEKKVPLLITLIGSETYRILKNLLGPEKPASKTFLELVSMLFRHFQPKKTIFTARLRFHRRDQLPLESLSAYIVELRKLASACKFPQTFEDEALRDRLICGVSSEYVRRRMTLETELTFDRACTLAQELSLVESNSPQQGREDAPSPRLQGQSIQGEEERGLHLQQGRDDQPGPDPSPNVPGVSESQYYKGDGVDNTFQKEPQTSTKKKALPLYEDDHRYPPIISKYSWSEERAKIYTILPIDYIVVKDGGKRCQSHSECWSQLMASEIQKTFYGDTTTVENFYVGDNGVVYEGRGWSEACHWHLNGLGKTAVTVKFLGSYESEGPSEMAIQAFWRMAKFGIWENKLSPNFQVLSLGQVYNDSTLVGHALEKVFLNSSRGVKEFNMMATWAFSPEKSLPLITREEWGAKKPKKPAKEMASYINYIIINEGGERCFSKEECISWIKAEQEKQLPVYGDLVDNFYIGEDGNIYEGRGFLLKSLWDMDIQDPNDRYIKEDTMTVRFFGEFHSNLPSEKAIGAFKLLVNAGLWMSKISDHFKIYSLRGIYDDPRFLGDKLFETAKKWTSWANELDERIAKSIEDGDGFIGMIKRTTWGAEEGTKELAQLSHPVEFIIIEERAEYDRSIDSEKSTEILKEIQKAEMDGYGDVRDNFYVSDNGIVYEGRGWDKEPQLQPRYFKKSLITVNFLGDHHADGASLTAIAALEHLIKVGVKLGKIAPNYHLYSSRDIYDDSALLGDSLRNYFVTKEEWSNDIDSLVEEERYDEGLLPIIPHKVWSEESSDAAYHQFTKPVHYVVVGNMAERCYDYDSCVTVLKEAEITAKARKEGLMDNFYIGDDGMAYEGRGWTSAPSFYHEGFMHEFYCVTFLGQYQDNSKPSDISFRAFNCLMKNGLNMNKIAPDYRVISIHQLLESGIGLKDNLYEKVKADERWILDFDLMPDMEGTSSGHKVFVSREDWCATKPLRTMAIKDHPQGFLLVRRAGKDCSGLASCIEVMQNMQNNLPPRYWDVADNFYVSSDGHIVEGRGWDNSSHWAIKGIENNFLSVGFLGSFESTPPTPKALLAFHTLLRAGVTMDKLMSDFKLVSMEEIVPKDVTEKFIGALKTTENWSDTFGLRYDAARIRSIDTSLVLSDEWNLSDMPIRQSSKLRHPLKYVFIRDGGSPCDTYETCLAVILKEHKDQHDNGDGGIAESFYIGNDGSVMEGTGWDWDMKWGTHGWQKGIQVQFLGSYENELPSRKAFAAFHDVLIKNGIETGKLEADYHVLPPSWGEAISLGKKLKEEIKTWKNFLAEPT